jgi:hypothetical protein
MTLLKQVLKNHIYLYTTLRETVFCDSDSMTGDQSHIIVRNNTNLFNKLLANFCLKKNELWSFS